jgi:hypothetical protein
MIGIIYIIIVTKNMIYLDNGKKGENKVNNSNKTNNLSNITP